MGIIVADVLTLTNGITLTDYYVHIDDIRVVKSNLDAFKYTVTANRHDYATKNARDERRTRLQTREVCISTDDLTDLHGQLYAEVKKAFTKYTDL